MRHYCAASWCRPASDSKYATVNFLLKSLLHQFDWNFGGFDFGENYVKMNEDTPTM